MAATSHPWFAAYVLTLITTVTACAPTAKSASEGATQGATQTLAQPETRQQMAEFLASPEMQKAIQDLSKDVTTGVTEGMASDEAAGRTQKLAAAIADTAARAAVNATLSEMSSPANQRRVKELTATADTVVSSSMRTMADEIPRTIGPAVATMVRDDLAPSLRGLADAPQLRAAVAQMAFEVSRQAILGSNEATAELNQQKPKKGAIAQLSSAVGQSGVLLPVGLLVLLALVVALLVVVLSTRATVRRYEAHDAAREIERDRAIEPPRRRPTPTT